MIKFNKTVVTVSFVPILLLGILLSVAHMWAAPAEVAQAAQFANPAALSDLRITEINCVSGSLWLCAT